MADRKETPDILGSLLGDKKPEEKQKDTIKPEYHKDSKPVRQQARKPVEKPTSKTVSQKTQQPDKAPTEAPEPAREPSGEKLKATYYISIEAVEALEEGWYQLRKLASTDARTGISKSLIVEEALQIVLEELERTGQKSKLAKKLLE